MLNLVDLLILVMLLLQLRNSHRGGDIIDRTRRCLLSCCCFDYVEGLIHRIGLRHLARRIIGILMKSIKTIRILYVVHSDLLGEMLL